MKTFVILLALTLSCPPKKRFQAVFRVLSFVGRNTRSVLSKNESASRHQSVTANLLFFETDMASVFAVKDNDDCKRLRQ